jgi:oligo-1,6-glucosidase
MVSRFGNDSPEYRELSSKLLNTFLLTMRGTPYVYNGDELGMTNIRFTKIEDYRDRQTFSEYKYKQSTGADLNEFMKELQFSNRDNGRTPMQWDASANAGFTTGVPWIAVNKNYVMLNVATQEQDNNSCLNYFKRLVQLRKENLALVYGQYQLLDKANTHVYSYTRQLGKERFLVVLNFSGEKAITHTGIKVAAKMLLNNYHDGSVSLNNGDISLRPWQACVFKL